MDNKLIIERQFLAFCEAWGIEEEEVDEFDKVELMKCFYLNGILAAMQIASQPIQVDPRLISPGR